MPRHDGRFPVASFRPGTYPRLVFRRLGLILASFALFLIAGGQWTVLQTTAWVGMLHQYTQRTGSIAMAIEQTFDGQHPCEWCRAIASAKAKEKKQPASPGANTDAKAKAMVAQAFVSPQSPPPILLVHASTVPSLGLGRAEQPPTPPPEHGTGAA